MQAHTRTKSIIEYEPQPFCNTDCIELKYYLESNDILLNEMYNDSDYQPNWEINRTALINNIVEIKDKPQNEFVFNDTTYGELVKIFTKWIDITSHEENYNNNDIIFIDWL